MVMLELGRIGGADNDVVPKFRTATASKNNVTPTDATGLMHYEFADTVHPTPYAYRLLAELVGEQMAIKGWL